MSETDTSEVDDPDKTNINIRLTETFLEDIDATWREEGYNSRSEFIRDLIRDGVKHPGLSRGAWKDIAAIEYERRTGEAESFSREDVLEMMDDDQ
jgi:metal-responsive CopG/Arc/MetJ family transcriptional regulator